MNYERTATMRRPVKGEAIDLDPCVTTCGHFGGDPDHGIARQGIGENIVIYCTDGRGMLRADHNIPITPGQCLLIRRGAAHAYHADPDDPWTIWWFHYTDKSDDAARAFIGGDGPCGVRGVGYPPHLAQLFGTMVSCMAQSATTAEQQIADAAAKAILLTLLSYRPPALDLDRARQYMADHLDKRSTLNELAAQAGLSKYHFVRRFEERYGLPPMQYFSRLRIGSACTLLVSTRHSIARISEMLGYASPYYFSEQFRQVMGIPPTKYRRHIQP